MGALTMANVIFNIDIQSDSDEKLEKFVDVDMDSVYKTFAQKKDVNSAVFTKEQADSFKDQIYKETTDSQIIALDKHFKHSIAVDYSGYKIAKNINVKAVQQSIHNIFSWLPGERIINPEFGTNLRRFLYEGITSATEELINAEIRQCLARWEPRAQLINIYNVSDVNDTENNTIHLEIVYTIPELSDKQYSYSYFYNKIT